MARLRTVLLLAIAWPVAVSTLGAAGRAAEPLHARLDSTLESAITGVLAPLADDSEFARRVHLDLVGRIPSRQEAAAFLSDAAPDKRVQLVDRLLSSPEFARHMAVTFDVAWMERRADKHVPSADWLRYLEESFGAGKPYNVLVREILAADGVDDKTRPAAKFYLEREGEPNLITRDIGRMFLGVDLQCAQCHNHPLIDDYLQADYYGIFAFVSRGVLFTDAQAKKTYYAETGEGDVSFKSVFTGEAGRTVPRLPGSPAIVEPWLPPGDEYQVRPAKEVRPVPKFSRRAALSQLVETGANRAFQRNIANRLWAHMMGRGLVEPVDLHHTGNPPANPALLDLLADEFVALKYDVKSMLRELALSRVYQRGLDSPTGAVELAAPAAEQLVAEQLAALTQRQEQLAAAAEASGKTQAAMAAALSEKRKSLAPIDEEVAKSRAVVLEARKAADAATQAAKDAQAALSARHDAAKLVAESAAAAQKALAGLPSDQELTAVTQQLNEKTKKIEAELPALGKDVEAKQAAAKPLVDKLREQEQADQAVFAKLAAAAQAISGDEQQALDAQARARLDQLALADLVDRIRQVTDWKAYQEQVRGAAQLETRLGQLGREASESQTRMRERDAIVAKLKEEMDAVRKAHDDAVSVLAASEKVAAERRAILQLAMDVAKGSATLREKFPQDTELVTVTELIAKRQVKATAELTEATVAVDAQQVVVKAAADRVAAAQKTMDGQTAELDQLKQQVAKTEAEMAAAREQIPTSRQAAQNVLETLLGRWTNEFAFAPVSPLTPEQLGWSMLQATGMIERQRPAAEAEVSKTHPLTDEVKNDPVRLAERERQVQLTIKTQLQGSINEFARRFGAAAGQPQNDFFATVDQALFFGNNGLLRSWLAPAADNLTERMLKQEDVQALADDLYLSVHSRRPSAAEVEAVRGYLATRTQDKSAAVQELAWALLTSVEFRFRH